MDIMVNRKFLLAALVLIAAVFLCGCTSDGGNDTATATTAAPTDTGTAATPEFLKIATTTSLDNTGLLADLKDRFEEDHDVTLQIIAAGTGKALEYGERGDVDVLMVHDRAREDLFMDNGYGINRRVPGLVSMGFLDALPAGEVRERLEIRRAKIRDSLASLHPETDNHLDTDPHHPGSLHLAMRYFHRAMALELEFLGEVIHNLEEQ